jgi:hypothetical protein
VQPVCPLVLHSKLLAGERHGIIQRGWLLEFDICFQRIAEAGRENINLLLLREAGAAVDKRKN